MKAAIGKQDLKTRSHSAASLCEDSSSVSPASGRCLYPLPPAGQNLDILYNSAVRQRDDKDGSLCPLLSVPIAKRMR